jgi:hypothetical protein
MPRMLFVGGDKDAKYEDRLTLPEESILIFDGYGGVASPRGKYVRTDQIIEVQGVMASVWECVDLMR